MKKGFIIGVAIALALTLALSPASVARAEVVEPGRLTVHAQAAKTVAPDIAELTIGVIVEDADQQAALSRASEVIGGAADALLALGVPESSVKTSRLTVTPRYSSSYVRRITGYAASLSLSVAFTDFEAIGPAIDAAVALGANDIGSLTYRHSDEGLIYRQALADAVGIARVKAEAMADAAGVRLGRLLSLQEIPQSPYASRSLAVTNVASAADYDGGAFSEAALMAGELRFSASVDLIFELIE